MKNLVKLFVLVLISTTLTNCAKEEILPNNNKPSTEMSLKHSDDDDDAPILGKSVNINGEPLMSANVALSLSGSPFVLQTTTTNSVGEYVFDDVDNNTYDVQISKTNYQTKTVQFTAPFSQVSIDTLILQ